MKTINKNWLWVIGGLMLLNIALLTFIWIKKPNHEPPEFLKEKLGFSEIQKEQFETLKGQHQVQMQGIKVEMERLRDKLYGNFSTVNFTDSQVQELTNQIGEKKAEGDFLTYEHFQEVRKICTPEQQREFDKLISEIVRGIDSQMPPPPDRNQEGRGGGPPEGRRPPPR
ncbi:MAG: Spy/CpxP family protein refolding chaperone [Spirosomaceae bacterium]|nr:Spy/CpxP family protein refolding chaperone [Spirosomataceae bacterium]